MNLLDFIKLIPFGKENAIPREELKIKSGEADRDNRTLVKMCVNQKIPILSSSGHKGYWRSEDLDEIETFVKETERRANTTKETVRPLKEYVAEKRGYKVIPVAAHIRRIKKEPEDKNQISFLEVL